jgi:hypothetical protein
MTFGIHSASISTFLIPEFFMEKDPQTLASEELIAANKKLISETEEKLGQLEELTREFRQLFAQQQGIDPSQIESFLAQVLPAEQIEQLRGQFQAEVGTVEAGSGTGANASAAPPARRPGPRRNIV